MQTPRLWGILGPHPEAILRKPDPRIATTWTDFLYFVDRLVLERPADARFPAISDEQLSTKH